MTKLKNKLTMLSVGGAYSLVCKVSKSSVTNSLVSKMEKQTIVEKIHGKQNRRN